jgi:hypothetical protein
MEKTTINANKECKFLADIPELNNRLPVNCLLNKGITGCGGTTIAIENEIDTIIAMPYVNVIKNKESQYPNDRCENKLLGIYEGVSSDKIMDYIKTHKIKKIAVTYDSLERLITLLIGSGIDVYNDYYLLVDEWHILFTSYVFRNKAIKRLLSHSNKFKEVTYMTATPIEEEFILKEIRHLPIVEVQWENTVKVTINPIEANNTQRMVCDIIKTALNGRMFGNLHFFVNSVEFIAVILKHLNLPPQSVRVVCSQNKHTGKGNKTNQSKYGKTKRFKYMVG